MYKKQLKTLLITNDSDWLNQARDEFKQYLPGRVGWTEPTTSTDYENRGYYHVSLVDQFYIPNNGRRYTSYTEEDMKAVSYTHLDVYKRQG